MVISIIRCRKQIRDFFRGKGRQQVEELEDKTDPADLGRVKQWMNAPASKAAISVVYADKEPEKKG